MDVSRLIFHCDCNNFFASCECLDHPELKNMPMAVAGDPQDRHGVVVAKNELAKRAGVKTTDTVWAAKRKCPGIVFVPPRHKLYAQISRAVNAIYLSYTDYVEPASIDESFLDLTGCLNYYGMTAGELADELRRRVREEIGVTISVGVSFNKTFAKMGSDYKKPDATTIITPENYRALLWPLPVSEMLFVGRSSAARLAEKGIDTIGALAAQPEKRLIEWMGKSGAALWRACNGLDDAPVHLYTDRAESKNISRGMTFRRDLVSEDEVRLGVSRLSEKVAEQLRREGLRGGVVQVHIRTPQLNNISRQATLPYGVCTQRDIADGAMTLLRAHWRIGPDNPIRAITVGVSALTRMGERPEQISLFDLESVQDVRSYAAREKRERLESAVDKIRLKHGGGAVIHGCRRAADIGLDAGERGGDEDD